MALIDIQVPDIGDFKDVAVIEVLVKPGDTVKAEQSLITVESDKASMEIPSSHGGVVQALKVKVGDTVNQGAVLLTLEVRGAAASTAIAPLAAPAQAPAAASTAASTAASSASPTAARMAASAAASYAGGADLECDLLVLGAGPGGYSAAFRAADLGMKTVLVERYPTLGGVCLNVGCIPSKALLHVAAVMDEVTHFADLGITFDKPQVDLGKLLAHKNKVVGKLTGGLAAMAKMRKVTTVQGVGEFADPFHLKVTGADGKVQTIRFKNAIIAAGSEAVKLPFLPKDDPRIVTSTGALELRQRPERMLVIGGGIIGLEMGTVYSTLGAKLDVVEMLDGLMQGADRDLVKVWQKMNAPRFDKLMLKTKTTGAEATKDGIRVMFEGLDGTKSEGLYDLVLQAVGRTPNGKKIGAERAGVIVGERGFIPVDVQMRTNVPHIFAIGDIVGQPMLAHKAVHEAHVAAEVAAGDSKAQFDARVIPSVAYTDPEVAWVGLTEDEAKAKGIKVKKGLFPWTASGRAIANGRDEGFTKLLFDDSPEAHGHGRILGGGIVGTHAGDMIGEVALAIEMGADMVDIGKTIHPHPTLGESIGMAAEVAHGSCTDLPPARR
jgi:dihydrolipoamide dehydrogenase